MGGLVCAIHRNAVLRFEEVPTNPAQIVKFDAQMRELYNSPTIAESIVAETDVGEEVCTVLSKHEWSHADRQMLLTTIEALYES